MNSQHEIEPEGLVPKARGKYIGTRQDLCVNFVLLLVTVMFIAWSAMLCYVAIDGYFIAARGKAVAGRVIDNYDDTSADGGGWRVTYTFPVANHIYTGSDESHEFGSIPVGSVISVRYAPWHPGVHSKLELPGSDLYQRNQIWCYAALGLTVGAVALVFMTSFSILHRRRRPSLR